MPLFLSNDFIWMLQKLFSVFIDHWPSFLNSMSMLHFTCIIHRTNILEQMPYRRMWNMQAQFLGRTTTHWLMWQMVMKWWDQEMTESSDSLSALALQMTPSLWANSLRKAPLKALRCTYWQCNGDHVMLSVVFLMMNTWPQSN